MVLRPGVGHRRNFLLACLCDVAVVLPGEQGTAAELVFALALGRRVATVGRAPHSAAELRAQAVGRIPRPDPARTPLECAIAAAYDSDIDAVPVHCHPLDADAAEVVRQLLR